MFLTIGRTIKQGFVNFWRNGWMSVATVSILVLSLYVVGVIFLMTTVTNNLLDDIKEKMNISIYFKPDIEEEKIFEIKGELESYKEIKSIEYVSKEKALEDFKKSNENEPAIIQSLEEIGENPLLASLVIKAHNSQQYEIITSFINSSDFTKNISRINYEKNKRIIDRLNNIINQTRKASFVLLAIFGLISILIIFNTIKITIYSRKKEIEVMRLVGASNMFIRLPFIFEGVIYGVLASILAIIFISITIVLVNHNINFSITSKDLVSFYLDKALLILGIQIATGVFLGIVSSWIAMRRYLKI